MQGEQHQRDGNTNVSNNANVMNNQENKTKHNQQVKNIVTKQKMSLWRKKLKFRFIQLSISLTLNNASTSRSDNYSGTPN